jgi:hypothetical protein
MDTQQSLFNAKAWNRDRWARLSAWQRAQFRGEYRHARHAMGIPIYQARGILNRAVSIATVYQPEAAPRG